MRTRITPVASTRATNEPPDLYVSYSGGIDRFVRSGETVVPELLYLAVSPVTFAPEPDMALLTLVALGAIAARRARGRR